MIYKYYYRPDELYHYGRSKKDGAPGVGTGNWRRSGSTSASWIREYENSKDMNSKKKWHVIGNVAKTAVATTWSGAMVTVSNHIFPFNPLAANVGYAAAATVAAVGGIKPYIDDIAAREKLKNNKKKREETEQTDENGIYLKNDPSTQKEDCKAVNPAHNDFGDTYKSNCALCTLAYDLRRRGYDVYAGESLEGLVIDESASFYKDAKIHSLSQKDNSKKVRKIMVENEPEGSRGYMGFKWKNMDSGHAVAYEIQDGKVVIYDAQSGKVYNNPGYFLSKAEYFSYFRTDDLEPDFDRMKKSGVFQ